MNLYVIDTVSQEQTSFVRKYLEEITDFDLGKSPTERYVGFSDTCGMTACQSNEPLSSAIWSGYKKLSVDEVFKYFAKKRFHIAGLRMRFTKFKEIEVSTNCSSHIYLDKESLQDMIDIIDSH